MSALTECLVHGRRCDEVYLVYYLLPRLKYFLEELEGWELPFPPPPWPGKEVSQELLGTIITYNLINPQPEPPISAELQLQTMIRFRDGLQEFVADLGKQIEQAQS